MTGDDDTGETGHAASSLRRCRESIKCTVTVILFVVRHAEAHAEPVIGLVVRPSHSHDRL
jgi:hypothetical protein